MNKEIMTIEAFHNILKEKLEERFGGACVITAQQIQKNNGLILRGLNIQSPTDQISPNIYIETFWEQYQEENATITGIVERILQIYLEKKSYPQIDIDGFMNFETAKENIFMKLVNTKSNKALLEDVPHVDYFDLSIVFLYMVQNEANEQGTIMIHEDHRKRWNTTTEDLYQIALANTPRMLPYQINSLQNVMKEIVQKQGGEVDQETWDALLEQDDPYGLYVLSNTSRLLGAASMLYPEILDDFGRALGRDFYILPSSIHEVLLLPEDEQIVPEQLQACVRDVNETQLAVEDILSDGIYHYDRYVKKVTKIL